MKNGIFGFIVALVICVCTFGILYTTKVINFSKCESKNCNCNNNNGDADKTPKGENLLCKITENINGNNFNTSMYKIDNTLIIVNDIDGQYLLSSGMDPLIEDEKGCKNYLRGKTTRTLISSDNEYNYYLYELLNGKKVVLKESLKYKSIYLVLDLGYYNSFGAVPYSKYNNYKENEVVSHNTYEVRDNILYEYQETGLFPEGENYNSSIVEYKYEFKYSNYTKTKTDNLYYCVAGCKA